MKRKEKKDLRRLSIKELLEKLKILEMAFFNFYKNTQDNKPSKGVPSAKDIRRNIARINTIIKEKKLEEEQTLSKFEKVGQENFGNKGL